jgi:hypothetical protein
MSAFRGKADMDGFRCTSFCRYDAPSLAFGVRVEAAMSEFDFKIALIIFVTKLIDPFAALPALVAGYFCWTWWQVVISAAAVGIFVEMVLVLFEPTPGIHQGRLLMAVLAAGVWSNLAFAFKTWRAKRA